ncbi:MAG: (d)CMP kinase [Candidatus Polarisedimenticolaceae bacterium]|nr:(d)CMP kinase [Candidatus Polarisedimenticolaceae bacterium]
MTKIITIDGPSGSGKGTISQRLANHFGWHFLDSGALYRLLGLAVNRQGIGYDEVARVVEIAETMSVEFVGERVLLEGDDVTDTIRTETAGNNASKVAAIPQVRAALLAWQHDYAKPPGLVADGRDMGSVVFPDAMLKVFLTASAEERAKRRYKQLKEKGLDVNVRELTVEIKERDQRDMNRSVAPLVAAEGALVLDSTSLSIEEVLNLVLQEAGKRL